mmetsp:Transcript_28082/g.77281  ORF Transcript_28082/g.77281 Transcript_28082/m.77281 type:complete len:417 (+) Transcript_28082:335-1585(+)
MLRHPVQQLLHAVEAAGELHEVRREAPDVGGEAIVARGAGCVVQLQAEHLRRGEGQGAAAVQELLRRAEGDGREAEVCEADGGPVVGDDEVRGLQVPMADHGRVQVRDRGRLLLAEALHTVLAHDGLAGDLGHLERVGVEVHVAGVLHDNYEVGLAVEGPVRPDDVRVGAQVAHDVQLAVEHAQLAHALDAALGHDLQGAGAVPRVLGLEHGAEGARSQLVGDGEVADADAVLRRALNQRLVDQGNALEDVARQAPYDLVVDRLQGPRRLLLERRLLMLEHQRGFLRNNLRPEDRLLHSAAGEEFLADYGHDIVGAVLNEGRQRLLHFRLSECGQGLLVGVHQDRHDRRRIRSAIEEAAAMDSRLDVRPHTDDEDAAGAERAVRLRAAQLREGLHVGKARVAQRLAIQFGLSEHQA